MRKILFRGKRIDNGEWVYGNLNYGTIEIKSIKDSYYISDFDVNPWDKKFYPVIPESVGQYTGLTDKNGKKIFEGDIVKETIASNYQPIGQIYYAPEFCQWRIEYINSIVLIGHIGKGRFYTILGNIHDNPELLEGKS